MAFAQFKIVSADTARNSLRINLTNKTIKAELAGVDFIDKDTKQHVAYIPSLELSGYGETIEKAREMIQFNMGEFFGHLIKLDSFQLLADLRELGWVKNKFFNKQFLNSDSNIDDALKYFNIEENSIKRLKLIAA